MAQVNMSLRIDAELKDALWTPDWNAPGAGLSNRQIYMIFRCRQVKRLLLVEYYSAKSS